MTDEDRERPTGEPDRGDLADPGEQTQPAEGGRAEMADLPGAETARTRPEKEDDQDVD